MGSNKYLSVKIYGSKKILVEKNLVNKYLVNKINVKKCWSKNFLSTENFVLKKMGPNNF